MSVFCRALVGAFAAVVVLNVQAQSTDENATFLAEQLVTIQFDQTFQGMKKQMPALMARMMEQVDAQFEEAHQGGSAAFRKTRDILAPLQERLISRMAEGFRAPEVRAELTAAAKASLKRAYLPAEIDSLAAYYRTPLGASVASKQAAVGLDLMPVVSEISGRVMQPALKEFMDEIKALKLDSTPSVKKGDGTGSGKNAEKKPN